LARVKVGPVYVIPGGGAGLVIPGNIDLTKRPIVRNANGSVSTVRSVSWNLPVRVDRGVRNLEVLMPEVIGQSVVSARQALNHFERTGQHLGMFDSVAHANSYAVRLHNWQAAFYAKYLKPKTRRR
jgi:hypothetical protein